MGKLTHERLTEVGAYVVVDYEPVDDDYVRILSYKRRRPGHLQFQRVKRLTGTVLPLSQLIGEHHDAE